MTPTAFTVQTIGLDLPALVGALSRRLHGAGVPVSAERAAALARALGLVAPVSRRRLYWTLRAIVVTEPGQVAGFDLVFAAVFGAGAAAEPSGPETMRQVAPSRDDPPEDAPGADPAGADAQQPWAPSSAPPRGADEDGGPPAELPVATLASDEELIRAKRFDAMDPEELARVYALMTRLSLATPRRLTRRACAARRGPRVDLRRTLRASLRTGGDPIRLARRRRRIQPRRIVLLCDISGSMEPYARAYLQFLTCAAGSGAGGGRNESFVFATRLTRLTRALRSRDPERAIAQAAATAPDWSSGTRIGDALKTFNDRHGRRGMARGAVVVILSDGWERGEPDLVAREMQRLARLAHRIVWVNPRVAAAGFSPRAGGMAAALPYCDALVSGHSLQALEGVAEAIAADRRIGDVANPGWRAPQVDAAGEEDWASASDWSGSQPGSSVAMPSGYGPSRGRTTPGWGRP